MALITGINLSPRQFPARPKRYCAGLPWLAQQPVATRFSHVRWRAFFARPRTSSGSATTECISSAATAKTSVANAAIVNATMIFISFRWTYLKTLARLVLGGLLRSLAFCCAGIWQRFAM
jgi:hypothetical protein